MIDKRVLAVFLAAGMGAASLVSALPAYASSPEFARSAEEWAALQDNKMEYWEIEGLIQEYNPTVQQNQYSYVKFRRDYGDTKDDVSSEYRRLADELRRDIEYPSDDDPSYASLQMAALTAEMTANQLDTQADNNLEDSEIRRLTYEMAEKTLAQTAQNNFIGLYSAWTSIRQSELKQRLAELDLAAAQAQAAVGTGTQIQVLNAQQALQDAGAAVITARSTAESTKQKLQIMLGWKADSQPEIGEVPALDLSRIDSMNPSADLAAALENNYTLRINKKKLQNSTGETDVKTLQSTIADNEARIAASLQTAYLNVTSAKNTYLYQQSNAALTAQTAAQTAQRYSLGTASRLDYETSQAGAEQAELAFRQSEYALLQAMNNYDWAVKGLAAASMQ
ncbi:MAG: TolC family protein [Stomatobaculum sp.]|nr:TolC family protein [Stomatobaculum sp.]